MQRITFIGAGHMAGAMIRPLSNHPGFDIHAIECNAQLHSKFQALRVQLHTCADQHIADTNLIVWAVRPQDFVAAAQSITGIEHVTQLSIMAGVTCQSLREHTKSNKVVRCMPNAPALLGKGITGVFTAAPLSEREREVINTLLGALGESVWCDNETLIDAITAVSGSGPAYQYAFIKALSNAAEDLGLSAQQAALLAKHTASGAAQLALASDHSIQTLIDSIAVAGGTTAAALAVMHRQGFNALMSEAVRSAFDRAQQLASPQTFSSVQNAAADYFVGATDKRPWGDWRVLAVQPGYIIKTIRVNAGQRLSLQKHQHRAEHWFILQGEALAEIDSQSYTLCAGQSVDIPVGAVHRIANPDKQTLQFIEVQYGEVLSESDIVRLSDDYGRLES